MTQNTISTVQNRLSQFDFAFNDIDERQVHGLASACFIKQGEHLLVVGGAGTGKTSIAMTIEDEAHSQDLTSHYLGSSSNSYSARDSLMFWDIRNIGKPDEKGVELRSELLDCDVLLVDEAERWLEHAPLTFTFLLCKRIELGKTNILVMSSSGWKHQIDEAQSQVRRFYRNHWDQLEPSLLHQSVNSAWTRTFADEPELSFVQQMQLLGVGIIANFNDPCAAPWLDRLIVPATREARLIFSELKLFPASCNAKYMYTAFDKAPVWHVLYTGEKSYRLMLQETNGTTVTPA
jgi:hypothetical protein